MSSVANRLARLATGTHAGIYRVSGGKVFGKMGGQQLCLLTTTGRRSGKPRTTPLNCFPHGDGLVVVASNGGSDRFPAWYHNLTAHPQVTVQVGGAVRAMTARTATEEERAEIWPRVIAQARTFAGYEKRT